MGIWYLAWVSETGALVIGRLIVIAIGNNCAVLSHQNWLSENTCKSIYTIVSLCRLHSVQPEPQPDSDQNAMYPRSYPVLRLTFSLIKLFKASGGLDRYIAF